MVENVRFDKALEHRFIKPGMEQILLSHSISPWFRFEHHKPTAPEHLASSNSDGEEIKNDERETAENVSK